MGCLMAPPVSAQHLANEIELAHANLSRAPGDGETVGDLGNDLFRVSHALAFDQIGLVKTMMGHGRLKGVFEGIARHEHCRRQGIRLPLFPIMLRPDAVVFPGIPFDCCRPAGDG